jgi:Resolvase, N terminal domain
MSAQVPSVSPGGPSLTVRRARPEDATVCGHVCYDAFYKISTTHGFPPDFPSPDVGYVSYQEQWLDSTGPFKDVMISMFATLAKQERARISERTIAGLKVARANCRVLGRPPVLEETVRKILLLNRHAGIGARKNREAHRISAGQVNAILTNSRQQTC